MVGCLAPVARRMADHAPPAGARAAGAGIPATRVPQGPAFRPRQIGGGPGNAEPRPRPTAAHRTGNRIGSRKTPAVHRISGLRGRGGPLQRSRAGIAGPGAAAALPFHPAGRGLRGDALCSDALSGDARHRLQPGDPPLGRGLQQNLHDPAMEGSSEVPRRPTSGTRRRPNRRTPRDTLAGDPHREFGVESGGTHSAGRRIGL